MGSLYTGPNLVKVVNNNAELMWKRIKAREAKLQADLDTNEDLVLEYQSPSGERLAVEEVAYYADTEDTLFFQGYDSSGNLCQVIVPVQSVNVLFRVLKVERHERQRKRIGFEVFTDPEPTGD